ncbi:uncharacterized protein LOC122129162 isoform X2 [Clupea harengus]|uniref:Uncharacterized protein LOC122129162 isoform X2 n=1 Tax=Clupea harengus TaxID=7950 RepID=A0A8M1KCZ0_CLUHA|nr:uncharacterized protein LOC122129162 isoform X2 [Clupea harengus]
MNSDSYEKIKLSFLSVNQEQGDSLTYLKGIEDCVGLYRHDEIRVKEEFTWTIGPFEDTIFKDNRKILENWQMRYLPDHMMMQVLGTIKNNSCELGCLQVVLMVCEDMKLYAYREMEMHLVADNLQELFDEGISFPGKKMFYHGQRFDKMTEADLKAAKKSDARKTLNEKHKKLLESLLPEFKASMAAFKRKESEIAPAEGRAKGQSPGAESTKRTLRRSTRKLPLASKSRDLKRQKPSAPHQGRAQGGRKVATARMPCSTQEKAKREKRKYQERDKQLKEAGKGCTPLYDYFPKKKKLSSR